MTTSPFRMVKGDYFTELTPAGIIRRMKVHGPGSCWEPITRALTWGCIPLAPMAPSVGHL
jgi:hypothetical protein